MESLNSTSLKPDLSKLRYNLLLVAVAAQGVTIGITWPLWKSRQYPPNLPAFDLALPDVSFGVAIIATLVLVLAEPRTGWLLHVGALLVSFFFDQYRAQPQIIAAAVLMLATIEGWGPIAVRWFLASLWFWAGFHKLVSPDWYGDNTRYMVMSLRLNPDDFQTVFCYGVALGEMTAGALAVFRPRLAAVSCVMIHLGICVFLSPLFYNHNESVIPWNIATAVIGCWVMWNAKATRPQLRWEWATAAVLMVYPMGFYAGLVDHDIAHVLYSENTPKGVILRGGEFLRQIPSWQGMAVPFRQEPRLIRSYFRQTAAPGDTLHIHDPRWLLPDESYRLTEDRRVIVDHL